jgi:hypothetical protein
MSHRTELKKLLTELHELTANDDIIEAAAIASYPPGSVPQPLPLDAPQSAIKFRAMLDLMNARTCPAPPPTKEIGV